MNRFLDNLNQAMLNQGLTQSELSRLSGITKAAISQYCSGKYIPKKNNLEKLSKALNVSEAWLLGSEGVEVPGYKELTAEGRIKVHVYIQDILPKYKNSNEE